MAKERYLIDTNVVIDFLAGRFNEKDAKKINKIIDDTPFLSIISKIELLGFTTNESHLNLLESFINDSKLHLITDEVVLKTIEIRRTRKIKLPDALIASTAIVNNLILVTRNIDDFKNIKDLKIINPHSK